MHMSLDKAVQVLLCGTALALATWFLLGPIGGFHHSYAFGVLIYMLAKKRCQDHISTTQRRIGS
jgi:hypothetical protein